MSGKEFLARLERALVSLPYEEREAALRYYEEYLLDAGEENEAAALKDLGSPEKLGEAITAASRAYAEQTEKKRDEPVLDSQKLNPFSSIKVDLLNAAVYVQHGAEYAVAFDFPENAELPEVSVRGDTLYIEEVKTPRFSFFGFKAFSPFKKGTVTLTLPDTRYDRFSFDMVNGSLKVPAFRLREMKAESVNGSIEADGIEAERIKLNSVNGSVNASNLMAAELCDCDTVNGSIRLSGAMKGKISTGAVNGSVHIRLSQEGRDYALSLSTITGSVRVNGEKMRKSYGTNAGAPNSVRADTVNGSIHVDFEQKL